MQNRLTVGFQTAAFIYYSFLVKLNKKEVEKKKDEGLQMRRAIVDHNHTVQTKDSKVLCILKVVWNIPTLVGFCVQGEKNMHFHISDSRTKITVELLK